jgi:hypothetical protein
VADLLSRLGFTIEKASNDAVIGVLDLVSFDERQTPISIEKETL